MSETLSFVDLFAGLGGFHEALADLGHECVFASEINEALRECYLRNYPDMKGRLEGDIRTVDVDRIPRHDILCAGFPCQPFSKSGGQRGIEDETDGTLFHEVLRVLRARRPPYVILENVGNFERHDNGNTWRVVQEGLRDLGYQVRGTEHVTPRPAGDWRDRGDGKRSNGSRQRRPEVLRGHGLISPHHFGHPQNRDRFFAVATQAALPEDPFPTGDRNCVTNLDDIVQPASDLSKLDKEETAATDQQIRCIELWNEFIQALPEDLEPPSFPLWSYELKAQYPFEDKTPWSMRPKDLAACIPYRKFPPRTRKSELLQWLPSYARQEVDEFPAWKKAFIRQNREWWAKARKHIPKGWRPRLSEFPDSLQKFEWNAKGANRNLWKHVLQFRPSGLRVRRYTASPALVAMTATQIPFLGPERRFLTRTEGLRLQGFDDDHCLPDSRTKAFAALGNAVHVDVVTRVAESLLRSRSQPAQAAPLVVASA